MLSRAWRPIEDTEDAHTWPKSYFDKVFPDIPPLPALNRDDISNSQQPGRTP
jgi:hypothetical protein